MTRKMDRRVLVFVLAMGLFLAGSGVAQSENGFGLYTVHATTGRVTIADQDCEEDGCSINYEIINAGKLARILCHTDERLPPSFTLATFIACDDHPNVMIGVWDVLGQESVCDNLYLYTMAEASTEGPRNRGKAELLLVTEEAFPMYVSARGRFGPLPRKFDMEQMCWSDYRTSAISGALSPGTVIKAGTLRGGGVIGLYGDFPR
ncbi:MAG: hypothetical protein JRE38_01275 [Deltaproteobacteria bacterium]|nr:hypothetical protein [Deltaproteobacteria bacterium]MBW2576678.1 hypothetical protein [Deltaproteobacteria bacterium]MBW2691336.1 hypothetical protein [Deltaproteobacteria bacterium]